MTNLHRREATTTQEWVMNAGIEMSTWRHGRGWITWNKRQTHSRGPFFFFFFLLDPAQQRQTRRQPLSKTP